MKQERIILVVGLGLIGGSVCMALRGFEQYRIIGADCAEETRRWAQEHDVCDAVADRVEEVLPQADVVVLAMHPKGITEQLLRWKALFRPGTLVTDVGGIKGVVMESARALPEGVDFIGWHPMAGKETSGIQNAEGTLFRNAHFIITPGEHSTPEHQDLLWRMGQYMGFRDLIVTTPEEHDRIIAYTSQLMHIIAVSTCDDDTLFRCRGFEGGSFRGCTRVAALDVGLWTDLFTQNAPALCDSIRQLEEHLHAYREVLEAGDTDRLAEMLSASAERKRKMKLE